MRVYYPVSARISDMVNDDKIMQFGWMNIWSLMSVVVLAIVFSSLGNFEGGAAEKQHEQFSKNHHTVNHGPIAKNQGRQSARV